MQNDESEKLSKALEEIRDLLKESIRTAEERDKARADAQRRRWRSSMLLFAVMVAGWFIYAFVISPMTQQRMERQMNDWRSMESNYMAHPK